MKAHATPESVMKINGKSFYFASQFFGKKQMLIISKLYSICRHIDDCADELAPEESKIALNDIEREIESININSPTKTIFTSSLLELYQNGVKEQHLKTLISGARFDVDQERIKTRKDLIIYAYKVAGVVGLMLSPLLGVKSPNAASHAIDLGIGMQLTNICRDVLEDAQNGRLYLPMDEIKEAQIHFSELKSRGATPVKLKKIIQRYLDIADQYYDSGLKGLSYIPIRSRFAALSAAYIYRGIGEKIRRNDYEVLSGRTSLNLPQRIQATLKSFGYLLTPFFWRPSPHRSELHIEISEILETPSGALA